MLSLYAEIVACIVGAGLVGLLCGWMIHSLRASGILDNTVEWWEDKYFALELEAKQDVAHLEDRLYTYDKDLKTLTLSNRSLDESAKSSEASIQQARADAIELNRQQAETQERLQRIIQQKDREITELRSAASANLSDKHVQERIDGIAAVASAGTFIPGKRKPAASKHTSDHDASIHSSETVSIDIADAEFEAFDNTVRINPTQTPSANSSSPGLLRNPVQGQIVGEPTSKGPAPKGNMDDSFDATDELNGDVLNVDESTIALDDEALAYARSERRSITDSVNDSQTTRSSSHQKREDDHKS